MKRRKRDEKARYVDRVRVKSSQSFTLLLPPERAWVKPLSIYLFKTWVVIVIIYVLLHCGIRYYEKISTTSDSTILMSKPASPVVWSLCEWGVQSCSIGFFVDNGVTDYTNANVLGHTTYYSIGNASLLSLSCIRRRREEKNEKNIMISDAATSSVVRLATVKQSRQHLLVTPN